MVKRLLDGIAWMWLALVACVMAVAIFWGVVMWVYHAIVTWNRVYSVILGVAVFIGMTVWAARRTGLGDGPTAVYWTEELDVYGETKR
jgi:hypothetical protein